MIFHLKAFNMTQPPVATELKKSSTFLAQGDFQERNAVANGVEKFGDGGVVIAVSETAFQVGQTLRARGLPGWAAVALLQMEAGKTILPLPPPCFRSSPPMPRRPSSMVCPPPSRRGSRW